MGPIDTAEGALKTSEGKPTNSEANERTCGRMKQAECLASQCLYSLYWHKVIHWFVTACQMWRLMMSWPGVMAEWFSHALVLTSRVCPVCLYILSDQNLATVLSCQSKIKMNILHCNWINMCLQWLEEEEKILSLAVFLLSNFCCRAYLCTRKNPPQNAIFRSCILISYLNRRELLK